MDRIYLIPLKKKVRSIHYYTPYRAFLGHYKSTEIYKLATTFEKSVFQERVFRCLIYSGSMFQSLFVKPYTEIISQKVINQTNITFIYYNNLFKKQNERNIMKEYYAEVKLEFANLVEAKSKKEAVSIIKEMYKEQMKVYLKDSEIRNIKIHND